MISQPMARAAFQPALLPGKAGPKVGGFRSLLFAIVIRAKMPARAAGFPFSSA
jgi:hypothetical protein